MSPHIQHAEAGEGEEMCGGRGGGRWGGRGGGRGYGVSMRGEVIGGEASESSRCSGHQHNAGLAAAVAVAVAVAVNLLLRSSATALSFTLAGHVKFNS